MKLKDYIKNLQDFTNKNPESLELDVVTSADDEGNRFNLVYFGPAIGYFDGENFIDVSQYEEMEYDSERTNSVCIN